MAAAVSLRAPIASRRFEIDRYRSPDYRSRSLRPVPGVRAGSAGHELPRRRFARDPRRPVHRAVSRQAHLRHPGAAGLRCAGAGRPAAAADHAFQCAAAPRPGSHQLAQARGRPLRSRNRPGHALRCRRGGDRRRRGIVPAAPHRGAGRGTLRGPEHPLPRARRGELPRQETGDIRRWRFRARLGHRLRRQGRGRHAGAPAHRIQGGTGLGGKDAGARGGRSGAVHRRSGRLPAR